MPLRYQSQPLPAWWGGFGRVARTGRFRAHFSLTIRALSDMNSICYTTQQRTQTRQVMRKCMSNASAWAVGAVIGVIVFSTTGGGAVKAQSPTNSPPRTISNSPPAGAPRRSFSDADYSSKFQFVWAQRRCDFGHSGGGPLEVVPIWRISKFPREQFGYYVSWESQARRKARGCG